MPETVEQFMGRMWPKSLAARTSKQWLSVREIAESYPDPVVEEPLRDFLLEDAYITVASAAATGSFDQAAFTRTMADGFAKLRRRHVKGARKFTPIAADEFVAGCDRRVDEYFEAIPVGISGSAFGPAAVDMVYARNAWPCLAGGEYPVATLAGAALRELGVSLWDIQTEASYKALAIHARPRS